MIHDHVKRHLEKNLSNDILQYLTTEFTKMEDYIEKIKHYEWHICELLKQLSEKDKMFLEMVKTFKDSEKHNKSYGKSFFKDFSSDEEDEEDYYKQFYKNKEEFDDRTRMRYMGYKNPGTVRRNYKSVTEFPDNIPIVE